MEEKIKVNLSKDHIFESETNILGREGEGNTSRLTITVPEELCSCSIYLDFEKPNGEKFRTPKLEVENGVAYYTIVPYLLTDEGNIKVQAVVKTGNGGTWKTLVKEYFNYNSINAEDYINDYPEKEDFLFEAQKVLDELSGEINEIATILSNNTKFVDNIINRVEEINIEEVDVLSEDVEALQGEVEMLKYKDETLQSGVATLQEDVDNLQEEIDGAETAIEDTKQKVSDEFESLRKGINGVGVLCAGWATMSGGTATLDETLAVKLYDKICFVTLSSTNDILAGVVTFDGLKNTVSAFCNSIAKVIYTYSPTKATFTITNADNGELRDYSGTLQFYIIGELRAIVTNTFYDPHMVSHTFEFEEGMIWEDWVSSKYNDGRIYLYDDYVCYRDSIWDDKTGENRLEFINAESGGYTTVTSTHTVWGMVGGSYQFAGI